MIFLFKKLKNIKFDSIQIITKIMDLLCDELILKIWEYLNLADVDNLSQVSEYEYVYNILIEEKRFRPKDSEELRNAIDLYDENEEYAKKKYGVPNEWDVSNITNMSHMFSDSKFNGNISEWNVSNVTNMRSMFYHSQFTGDISEWTNKPKITQ